MRILVTGSAGYLGESLASHFSRRGDSVSGLDIVPSPFTTLVGSIIDHKFIEDAVQSADVVLHTATLHKPHLITHSKQQFINVNIVGTQNLLDAAVKFKVKSFIFTSTTSLYGHALTPTNQSQAVWVTEDLVPKPKNIYGVTKLAAESLCELAHREYGLPCLILRTSRFFPGDNIPDASMKGFSRGNLKAIEFLGRRVDIADVVSAHEAAIEKAAQIGFDKFIISATTPFQSSNCLRLWSDPNSVIEQYFPDARQKLLTRVYVNTKARHLLDWPPKVDFTEMIKRW